MSMQNEKLDALRGQIDGIDKELLELFQRRMDVVGEVAAIKGKNNLPILDSGREDQVIEKAAGRAQEAYRGEVSLLMRTIMALSKGRQRRVLFAGEAPLLPEPREPKRDGIVCVHQGVRGAWSEQALEKVFPGARKLTVDTFEDAFLAVKDGKADYGIIPIENSQTGAIGQTYDLLRKYGCYIVGRTWIDIKQCLLAPEGTAIADVKQVYSHPEALGQCRRFLQKHPWEQVACSNTAVAAELVAGGGDGISAAIGSRYAAQCTGLAVLEPDIMDSATNRTAFVVIAAQPEYDGESDMVSVTFTTAHRSGALCETLMPFMALGINLARIESRPGTAGDYRFFADLEGSLLDEGMGSALRQAAEASAYFEVIGCYKMI